MAFLTLRIADAEAPIVEQQVAKQYPEDLPAYKELAYDIVLDTWDSSQWELFNDLINRESGWNSEAQNPTSSAYGYGQFLNSTWAGVGCIKTSDPDEQIRCTIKYVESKYGTPQKAIIWHNANNWY